MVAFYVCTLDHQGTLPWFFLRVPCTLGLRALNGKQSFLFPLSFKPYWSSVHYKMAELQVAKLESLVEVHDFILSY